VALRRGPISSDCWSFDKSELQILSNAILTNPELRLTAVTGTVVFPIIFGQGCPRTATKYDYEVFLKYVDENYELFSSIVD
jgi:hypothetical protein